MSGRVPADDLGVDAPLQRPPVDEGHEVGGEADGLDVEHERSFALWSADRFLDCVQQYADGQ